MVDSIYCQIYSSRVSVTLPPADLEPWLARDDLTLDELVAAADGLLARLAPQQHRYKVTARPDVRTIRYYTSQGLLPKPASYEGGRARYGGVHLLRLLLVKRLQAEHLTLARIRAILADKADAEVFSDLTGAAPGPPAPATTPTASPASSASPLPSLPSLPSAGEGGLGLETFHRAAITDADETLLATVEIPAQTLRSPDALRSLADRLVDLAERLRTEASTPSTSTSTTPAPHEEPR